MKIYLLYILFRLLTSIFYLGASINIAQMYIVFLFSARDRDSTENKYSRETLS